MATFRLSDFHTEEGMRQTRKELRTYLDSTLSPIDAATALEVIGEFLQNSTAKHGNDPEVIVRIALMRSTTIISVEANSHLAYCSSIDEAIANATALRNCSPEDLFSESRIGFIMVARAAETFRRHGRCIVVVLRKATAEQRSEGVDGSAVLACGAP